VYWIKFGGTAGRRNDTRRTHNFHLRYQ